MTNAPAFLIAHITPWPTPAQMALLRCRDIFHDAALASGVGPLEESLKWGQPAWRPAKPRVGSTLRVDWTQKSPKMLSVYVDCKTDLADRMRQVYPMLPLNDGRRHMAFDLQGTMPDAALAHLAQMTFAYHLNRRRIAS